MTDIERRLALLRSRSLMVPTTDPTTSKRPAEEPSSKPSSMNSTMASQNAPTSQPTYTPLGAPTFSDLDAQINKLDETTMRIQTSIARMAKKATDIPRPAPIDTPRSESKHWSQFFAAQLSFHLLAGTVPVVYVHHVTPTKVEETVKPLITQAVDPIEEQLRELKKDGAEESKQMRIMLGKLLASMTAATEKVAEAMNTKRT